MIPTLLRALLLSLGLGLSACTTSVMQPVTPIAVDAGATARMISAFRAENGLGAVHVESRLMREAASYARAMGERDTISHQIGGALPRRIAAVGYDWGAAAENLGAGYRDLDDVMQGWKNSPGHRKNLLNPLVTDIGIAAVATPPGSQHRTYWALVLAMPQPDRGVGPLVALRRIR
jgi:uncharacterized protein YkwD